MNAKELGSGRVILTSPCGCSPSLVGRRGVFQLRIDFNVTPAVKRYVFVYVLIADGVYLIDTGVKGAERDILDFIALFGLGARDIKGIALTHAHPDHIGAAAALVRLSGAEVYAPAAERAWIEDIDAQFRDRPIPNFYNLVGGSVVIDRAVADGDVIRLAPDVTLRVVAAPGHSAGSTAYVYEEARAAFIGDAVPVPGDIPIYVSVADSLATLDRLGTLDADLFCPAWDRDYAAAEFEDVLAGARGLITRIDACVRGERAAAPQADDEDVCARACEKLGMTAFAANPLFLRSIKASLCK